MVYVFHQTIILPKYRLQIDLLVKGLLEFRLWGLTVLMLIVLILSNV